MGALRRVRPAESRLQGRWPAPQRALLCFGLAFTAFAAEPATITGRVLDVYHRPVRAASVVTIDRRRAAGKLQSIPGARATVDVAGQYRLALPPGRYLLAVTPPPGGTDFATVFPAYFQDTVEIDQAKPIELRPGEVRPFVDFLLLDVESHRIAGEVTPAPGRAISVSLYATTGFVEALRTVETDARGHFRIEHVPAGSYELRAGQSAWYGSVHIDVVQPEITGIQIHLQADAR